MKKLLVSVVALAMAFAVTSCNPEDLTAPEITLPSDALVLDLGDKEAALKNVIAKDKEDGDIAAANIQIVGLDFVGGSTLTYSIADKAGNVGTAERKVSIKPDKLFGNYLAKQNGAETGYNVEVKKSGSDNTKLIMTNFAGNDFIATFEGDGKSTVLTLVPLEVVDDDGVKGNLTGKINYKKGAAQYELIDGDYKVTWEDDGVDSFTLMFTLK